MLDKLTDKPSKAKIRALARPALVCAFLLLSLFPAHGGNIDMQSGPGTDTVIRVGPAGDGHRRQEVVDIESAPGNDTVIRVEPETERERRDPGTIIVAPRVHVRQD